MSNQTPIVQQSISRRSIIVIMLILIGLYGVYFVLGDITGTDTAREVAIFGAIILLTVLIMRQPVIGLSVIVSTVLFQNLFFDFDLSENLFTVMGVITGISYIVSKRNQPLLQRIAHPGVFFALAFIIWGTVTHTDAALMGTRSWLLTYIQLFGGVVLAAELLIPERQRWFMVIFVMACVPSAIAAFNEAEIVGVLSRQLVRGAGFQGNQNALAFYLCIAIVFTMWLHFKNPNRRQHVVYFVLYAIFILGVVGTVSRAGFLMLVMTLILPPILFRWASPPPENRTYAQQQERRQRRERQLVLLFIVAAILLTLFIPDAYWDYLYNNLFAVREWDSGVERRFDLVELAARTWQNNLISGVGFGEFINVSARALGGTYTAHNLYLVTLAETGTIGFVLFIGMLLSATYSFYQVAKRRDGVYSTQAAMWLSIMMLVFLRGPTASTLHYDKLLWMLVGVGAAMAPRWLIVTPPKLTFIFPRKRRTQPLTPLATPLENPTVL